MTGEDINKIINGTEVEYQTEIEALRLDLDNAHLKIDELIEVVNKQSDLIIEVNKKADALKQGFDHCAKELEVLEQMIDA